MVLDIRSALRAFLLADAAISSAVGGERIFPVTMPQGERRVSLVYARISGQGDHHMTGPSGLTRPRYQIDAYAPLQDDAVSLGDLVKDRLDGFSGLMGAIKVRGVFVQSERDFYEPPPVSLYRLSRDYFIWHLER